MNIYRLVPTILLLIALSLGNLNLAQAAPAMPPTPSSFYGAILFVSGDGEPSPGDYIEAYLPDISSYVVHSAIFLDNDVLSYALNIPGDDPDTPEKDGGLQNDLVTFKIGTRIVGTSIWQGGTNYNVDIHPPQAIPGGPYYGNTNQPINMSGSAADLYGDEDYSSFVWKNSGGGITLTGTNVTYTHSCPEYSTCGGDETWSLKVKDAQGGEGITNFHVIVNNTPWAYDQSVTTAEDTPKDITLTGFDPENGYNIAYVIVTDPAHGSLSGTPPNVTYTPATDYNGTDSFTFETVDDKNAHSPTHTISITVEALNDAPVLDPIGGKSVDEGVLLTFTASASDVDLPPETLTFSLANGGSGAVPGGAAIDSASGVFTWTPSEVQGPGSYTFDVCVSDGTLSDYETITVTVNEVNQAPLLDAIGNQSVSELETLTFIASASDADLPANSLAFSLVDAPSGAAIDSASGVFTWTPSEAQGPADYTFTVKVCDNGSPMLCDEEQITVTVNEAIFTYDLTLLPGWNLVSFNLHPTSTLVEDVLAPINGQYNLVYAWDATGAHSGSGNWLKYDPAVGFGNTLTDLDEKMGFWINITASQNQTLTISGTKPTTTQIDLLNDVGGWNLVGFPAAAGLAMPGALTSHGVSNYALVYAYHANDPSDPWKLYDPFAPTYANDLGEMTPGWGYWIMVTTDQTWSISY